MHPVVIICVAALGLLLFGLGLAISMQRFRTRTLDGHSAEPTDRLHRLVAAHANTAEFAPYLAVLFLYLGSQAPGTATVALIVAATLCRFLLVLGLLAVGRLDRPNPLRFTGALGTYLLGAALCLVALAGI
ncbi:MAG: MAPEG family protein [Proteobacteria bacterium]|nr:MAPEG family protein [Pseudomonadota bacterium]